MKKLLLIAAVLAVLIMPSMAQAVGSCTQTPTLYDWGDIDVKFVCTGDSANGSIPTQTIATATMDKMIGRLYLYKVIAYPTSGGTAPDAADITVKMNGEDLLGGKGANLIHATATQRTAPYSAFMTTYDYASVTNTITVSVANQGTKSANYTIVLEFRR